MAQASSQREAAGFTYHPQVSSFATPPQTYLATRPDPRYSYIATGCFVFDRSEPEVPRILLLQRSETDSMPGCWEIPGGACDDDDESILHGAARELLEETGLTAIRIGPQIGQGELFSSRSGKMICKFKFFVEVELDDEGRPSAVKLDPEEHQQYVWATQQEVEARSSGSKQLVFTTPDLENTILKSFSSSQVDFVDELKCSSMNTEICLPMAPPHEENLT
ncbi:hypothetical protein CKM354_001130700 [Cercospora kikuchii]|uniref:Nudix hydrolase domain-containing protein n=1 Tax=Cercospora kikuchii TaxID=84275 RepID=A0A9P3FKZ8_9PEZI|nr:uncharacterized protein CKM354_001130700 [Cercospora kikuchii]GIZ48239.1 hypothetical protein CKM354_001130700 [Cercospora kikuchii]